MFIVGSTGIGIYQYNLSAPFSFVNELSMQPASFEFALTSPQDVIFVNEGRLMYIVDSESDFIVVYRLASPFNITGAVPFQELDLVTIGANTQTAPRGLTFLDGGPPVTGFTGEQHALFMIGSSPNVIDQYIPPVTLHERRDRYYLVADNGDRTSRVTTQVNLDLFDNLPTDITLVEDSTSGTRLYILGTQNNTIHQYGSAALVGANLNTDDRISDFNVTAQDNNPQGLWITQDGRRIFVGRSTKQCHLRVWPAKSI